MPGANPYGALDPMRVPAYEGTINAAYEEPDVTEGSPYLASPSGAYAAKLNVQGLEIPDAMRLGTQPIHERRPQANRAPEEFWRPLDADTAARHSVETIDADGWATQAPGSKRAAPNPRTNPPPEPRLTSRMGPGTYSFVRPFDQQNPLGQRRLTGVHFSMADHRRQYEILGMMPQRTLRNTYRVDPPPWDANLVDLPPQNSPGLVGEPVQVVDVPYASTNYRLGG